MPINQYFNPYPKNRTSEQHLVEDLLREAIQIYGQNCYYILRESQSSQDLIFGEDPTSKFEKVFLIEMYINNVMDFDGRHDTFTKFGVNIQDDVTVQVTRIAFNKAVPSNLRKHPQEGDLIYVPVFNKLVEVKWVEQNKPMFSTLGSVDTTYPYIYSLTTEAFRYSNEPINTGYDIIDNIEVNNAFTVKLQLSSGLGTYQLGETVYVGASYALATNTGEVANWDPSTNIIELIAIQGQFTANTTLRGLSSNASFTITSFDDRGSNTPYEAQDNLEVINSANTVIDFTDENIMGAIN